MARSIAQTVVALAIAVTLTLLTWSLLEVAGGTDARTAFLDSGPRTIFSLLWPAMSLWAVLMFVGNVRSRDRGDRDRFLAGVMAAVGACLGAVFGWLLFSIFLGGWGLLLFAISLGPTAVFFIAAAVASFITHFGFFRTSPLGA